MVFSGRLPPSIRRMPDWKPIASAPVFAVLAWFAAYWVAEHRGPPEGDTNFSLMPLLPIVVGAAWLTSAFVILLIRLSTDDPRSATSVVVVALAALANGVAVAAIYGITYSNIGGDGWPDDAVALGALAVAGIVSLSPIAWMLAPRRERPARQRG